MHVYPHLAVAYRCVRISDNVGDTKYWIMRQNVCKVSLSKTHYTFLNGPDSPLNQLSEPNRISTYTDA
jgi:hypothetical protein